MTAELLSLDEVRLDEALGWYFEAQARGETLARSELFRRYPDLADDIRQFFADEDGIHRLTGSLCPHSTRPSTPTRPSTAEGTPQLISDYEIQEEIGKGGMGVVYRALQKSASRIVALKMIQGGQFASDSERERFQREVEATAALDHPNIVPIYEVGATEDRWFFSMKLIPGGSLGKQVVSFVGNGRAAARLVSAVARAVHHAHLRGILHRDIKPGNILLSAALVQGATEQYRPGTESEWMPYVTDFGLAKRLESNEEITQSGAIVGTPEYMSPEQASARKDLTTATDVYSLGAVLYAVLTGRPPFRGSSLLDTLKQVTEREVPAPRTIQKGVDPDLETICLKCLRKEPGERYSSAEALADELERWLRGEPITARPCGQAERAWRWCRRNRVVAGLMGLVSALALGLVVGLAGFSWLLWQESDKKEKALEKARNDKALADRREQMARDALDEVAKAADPANGWMTKAPQLWAAKRSLLMNTLRLYEELLRTKPNDSTIRHRTAQAHLRVFYVSSAKPVAEQVSHLVRAEELWSELVRENPREPYYRSGLAEVYRCRAQYALAEREMFEWLWKDAELVNGLVQDFPENLDWCDLAACQRYHLGSKLAAYRRYEEAEKALRKGLSIAVHLCRKPNHRPSHKKHVATNMWMLGNVLVKTNRRGEGVELLRNAIGVQNHLIPALVPDGFSTDFDSRLDLTKMRIHLAQALLVNRDGKLAGAELRLAEAELLALGEKHKQEDNQHRCHGDLLATKIEWLVLEGKPDEAAQAVEEYLANKHPILVRNRAWLAATGPGTDRRDPQVVMTLARDAMRQERTAHTARILGAALLLARETGPARVQLEWSLEKSDDLLTRLLLARVRHHQGDVKEATTLYAAAVKRAEGDSAVRDDPEWRRLSAETAKQLGLASPK